MVPLLQDAYMSIIFYTGEEGLTAAEADLVRSYGNIFLQTGRGSFTDTISTVVDVYGNCGESSPRKESWCVMYCGSSDRLRDEMAVHSKEVVGVAFRSETFRW
mmetsp:Transcript_20553/g.30112  ORF Transcript_20553/g.30112 Transcript_20553/m.30112 type:complete len:103 (+) Transcript_20553:952-1260(+)